MAKPGPHKKRRALANYALPGLAFILILTGVGRLLWTGKFHTRDAIWMLADIPLAGLSLMVFDFIRFRTRLPLWLFAVLLLALVIVSCHFSVGLGAALALIWIFSLTH